MSHRYIYHIHLRITRWSFDIFLDTTTLATRKQYFSRRIWLIHLTVSLENHAKYTFDKMSYIRIMNANCTLSAHDTIARDIFLDTPDITRAHLRRRYLFPVRRNRLASCSIAIKSLPHASRSRDDRAIYRGYLLNFCDSAKLGLVRFRDSEFILHYFSQAWLTRHQLFER